MHLLSFCFKRLIGVCAFLLITGICYGQKKKHPVPDIQLDNTGKITKLATQSVSNNSAKLTFNAYSAHPLMTEIDGLALFLTGTLPTLIPDEMERDRASDIIDASKNRILSYYNEIYAPAANSEYEIRNGATKELIVPILSPAPPSLVYENDMDKYPKIWITRKNVVNAVFLKFYNYHLGNSTAVTKAWSQLYEAEKQLFLVKNLIYNLQLADVAGSNLYIQRQAELARAFNELYTNANINSAMTDLNLWAYKWLGNYSKEWTINPFKVIDKSILSILGDTARIKDEIAWVQNDISKLPPDNIKRDICQRKYENLRFQLNKLLAYSAQSKLSEAVKDTFTEYTVISQLEFLPGCDYQRYHNAANELQLDDEEAVKKITDITNDEKVCFSTYNIPYYSKVEITTESKAYVEESQLSAILGPVGSLFALKNETGVPPVVASTPTLEQMISFVGDLEKRLAPYTYYLPPAPGLKFSKQPAFDGYKMQTGSIGPSDRDSALKNIYVIKITDTVNKVAKPIEKSFTYKSYTKSRVQVTTGVVFYAGDAPIVTKKENSTEYTLKSNRAFSYLAGVKFYFRKQTFSHVTLDNFRQKAWRSLHVTLALDLDKPLQNLYPGIGWDIIPGLGVDIGPHIYRYTKYQIYNGEEVGKTEIYRLRQGGYISVTLDGSVFNNIFKSLLKLR